jgi:two-component system cell cycle sensor histidine kinase/response regulator CckA
MTGIRRMKVLVVDDEEMILDMARRVLDRAEFEVETASNGDEALRVFETDPKSFRVAVVDYALDGTTGAEVVRQLRRINSALPVILSSGYILHPSDLPADIQPNVSFLQKPYRANDLVARVTWMLETNRSLH